ncbi:MULTISPECIES: AglZ/HisF2 family acetamidino modification protein [Plesiomonas]|uniref:imidazole glycerol-phosphate synthase n=1 Tax=Plesiomonas shigelloides TaxID=703 RepID=A0A4D6U7R6_PLESH|nr:MULTISPECIES: AglZ/HisF2 family acetamidino modification protein [Plesiomonas]KAB7690947.1 imidazole glycerol phosphate synthase subunit HisF [Plesiomonas shigelloides]MCE5164953.1 AglZ/HisF2 family acetamidino modification protein [Plesiomonas sp. PI-19]MCQ8858404.1 AglZ/HisF2 family acetamidino modification protein [Plesiomonas shigelloides]QCH03303.1 imidazole glycerol phosphate synthase subunit HisF [Plesiomonas shigelloides]
MLRTRVIPVLLLQNGGLVKGEKFKKHKYVGDPINAVRIFNEKEVDELAFIDISVGINGNEPDYTLIEDMASEAFMPIAYGGGIKRLDQVEKLFLLGVEKVIINSEFHNNPELVKECSKIAGAQSIVVAIDVKKNLFGRYEVYTHNGTHKTGVCPVEYAKKAQLYGAGEIVLTSIDREGSAQGLDLDLIKKVTAAVEIPVIVQGGVGHLQHIKQAVKYAGASAVAVGSFFTFHGKHKAVLLTYPAYQELENLFLD